MREELQKTHGSDGILGGAFFGEQNIILLLPQV